MGRGAGGKTPFVAAAQTTDGHQLRAIKLSLIDYFRSTSIRQSAENSVMPGATAISDGLACFQAVKEASCAHDRIVCGGGKASVKEPESYWVNTVLGNLESALGSTYHPISAKRTHRYLAQFVYRFNRRYNLDSMIALSQRTPPMPERLLRAA